MQRESKVAANTPQARRAPADHGITINASTHEPARFEALCLCGFASPLEPDRRRAVAAGQWHIADEQATLESSEARHDPTDAELAASDLEWTDEGVRVFRLPWMTDTQWRYVREGMQAWWDGWLAEWQQSRDGAR